MKNTIFQNLSLRAFIFSGLLTVAFLAAGFVGVEAHEGSEDADCHSRACRQTLVAAKQATAKYHDFQTAIDDGYVQVSPCIEVPGVGAMGFHYGNWERLLDFNADATRPDVLLYIPDENGVMRLVGLEYAVPVVPNAPVPTLFEQQLTFSPALGAYALHVWAWRNNPRGIFADFNPKLSCPQQ
jgi:hypothetical protein